MWSLLRRFGVEDPALRQMREDCVRLESQVIALRSKLTVAEESKVQMRRDLRESCRLKVTSAYEPVTVGSCRKVRYLWETDARKHAMEIARKEPDSWFCSYQCDKCPPYPSWDVRPWHAGHSRAEDPNAFRVNKGVIDYSCGCSWMMDSHEALWVCDVHKAAVDA